MLLHGIANKPVKLGPMQPAQTVMIGATGLDGSYQAALPSSARSRRQVTVLSLDQWQDALREIGSELPWYMRRANLCVTHHHFGPGDLGRNLTIGNELVLEITGETDPCYRMDAICDGLQAALRPLWRGGATCRVIVPGAVRVGDAVALR